jgi:hypothetical protein
MIARAEKYGIWSDILQQAKDLDMISYQKELLKGYVHVYNGKNGGYVQKAKNWEHNINELDATKDLANRGHQVYLLPRTRKAKSADMLIDNNIGEIKHQKIPTASSLTSELIDAGKFKRARIVDMHILDKSSFDDIRFGLWNAIHRTPIQIVILNWRGRTWELPRKLIMQKGWNLP